MTEENTNLDWFNQIIWIFLKESPQFLKFLPQHFDDIEFNRTQYHIVPIEFDGYVYHGQINLYKYKIGKEIHYSYKIVLPNESDNGNNYIQFSDREKNILLEENNVSFFKGLIAYMTKFFESQDDKVHISYNFNIHHDLLFCSTSKKNKCQLIVKFKHMIPTEGTKTKVYTRNEILSLCKKE